MPAPKIRAPQAEHSWHNRPVAKPIADRLCKLSVEYRSESDDAKKRTLERKIHRLESYVIVLLSHRSRDKDRDQVVLDYAKKRLEGWKGTWNKFRKEVDDFEKKISVRSKGRPTERRREVTKALESRLISPSKSYSKIAQELGWDAANLKREVRRLRRLLRAEEIQVPSRTN